MSERSERSLVGRDPFFSELDIRKGWEPFRQIEELLADWPRGNGVVAPKIDITENEDKYQVRAELPGVSKDDITVEIEDRVLNLRGEKKERRDEKLEKGRRLECTYGAFSRSILLPQDADADHVTAEFRDGVLNVGIAKRPETKAKQIALKG